MPLIQRRSENRDEAREEPEEEPEGESIQVKRLPAVEGPPPDLPVLEHLGPGEPLAESTRQYFEPLLGYDLGTVRIHRDGAAQKATQAVNALAFTRGKDVVFSPEQYAPDSEAGKHLLAHELTHVVQQGQAPVQSRQDTGAEREAGWAASRLATGERVSVRAEPDARLQRQQTVAFSPHMDLGQGLVLDQDIAAGQAILSYNGEPWVVYSWTPAPNRQILNMSLSRKLEDRKGEVEISVTADFDIEVSIDRWVEQSFSDYSQVPITVKHDYRFSGSVSISQANSKTSTRRVPGTIENSYDPRPLPGELGEVRLGPIRLDPEKEPPAKPKVFEPRVWTFDSVDKFDQFAATHTQSVWACIMTSDGKFVAFAMTRDHLRRLSQNIRRGDYSTEVLGDYPGSRLVGVYMDGRRLDSLQILANRYYRSEFDALEGIPGDPQECEVYNMNLGDYGRKPLTHEQAVARWAELDTLSYDEILKTETEIETKPNKPFEALRVRGLSRFNTLDWQYFQAKDRFFKRADEWNTPDMIYKLDPSGEPIEGTQQGPLNFFLTHSPRMGGLVRDYLYIETDRPNGDPQFKKLLQDHSHLANQVADEIVLMVENTGQQIMYNSLRGSVDQLMEMGNSLEKMKQFVLMLPLRTAPDRKNLLQFIGVPEDKSSVAEATLGNVSKAVLIVQGNKVDDVTLGLLQFYALQTAGQLDGVLRKLNSWDIVATHLEGDIGDSIRDQTYRKLGFKVLHGNTYPHTKETSGFLPGPLSGATSDFTNLAEQMYANRMALSDRTKTIMTVVTIGGAAVISVVLIVISGGAGAGIAAWIWGTTEGAAYAITEVVASGLIFTSLSVGKDYLLTGQNPLDPNAPGGRAGDLAAQAGINIATFGLFRGLNAIFGAVSKGIATGVAGGEEAFLASKGAQAAAAGLRISLVGGFFIGLSLEQYKRKTGRYPEGKELYLVLYENILMLTMLEVGGFLSRPYTNQLGIWARGRTLSRLESRYSELVTQTQQVQTRLSGLLDKPDEANQAAPELMSQQRELLEKEKELVQAIEDAFRGQPEEAAVKREAAAERGGIEEALNSLKEAEFLKAAHIVPDVTKPDSYYYEPGKEDKIKEFYGEKNVSKPDKDGVIQVHFSGRVLSFRPVGTGGVPAPPPEPEGEVELSARLKAQQEKLSQRQKDLLARADRLGFTDTTIEKIRNRKPLVTTKPSILRKLRYDLDNAEKQIQQAESYETPKLDRLAREALRRVTKRIGGPDEMKKVRAGALSSMTDAEIGEALRITYGEQGLGVPELRGLLFASRPGPNGERIDLNMIFNQARSAAERNFVLRTFGEIMEANKPGGFDVLQPMTTGRTSWRGGVWVMEYAKAGVGLENVQSFESTEVLQTETGEKVRRYDIVLSDGTRVELKDWTNWFPDSLKSQFSRDVLLRTNNFTDPTGLRNIRWVFRSPAPVPEAEIRSAMQEALQKVLENQPQSVRMAILQEFANANLLEVSSARGITSGTP